MTLLFDGKELQKHRECMGATTLMDARRRVFWRRYVQATGISVARIIGRGLAVERANRTFDGTSEARAREEPAAAGVGQAGYAGPVREPREVPGCDRLPGASDARLPDSEA